MPGAETRKEVVIAGRDALAEMDFAARLGSIQCPVKLVAAEFDHGGGPVESMREMANQIAGAKFQVIPGSGHICVAEAPDAVTEILADFLSATAEDKPTQI